jgi:putative restriction endonuclease
MARKPLQEIAHLAVERQRVVRTVTRLVREAHFREQVLRAYGYRCAVTGVQLRLVEAAHLLPVGAPGSIDDVRNGIALSPTYHRAYDRGLIYLDTDLRMKLGGSKARELTGLRLDGGLVDFRGSLGKILLPPDRRQWPAATFIAKANRFRNVWSSVAMLWTSSRLFIEQSAVIRKILTHLNVLPDHIHCPPAQPLAA